ncbi:MAG TPA: hypothetical protein P5567_08295 [Kiritimatiellia bacterium]|nr:hypothetical protein [Kiritimatiellia bacterium]HRZ12441.1 hypothetical protein [Kiritimatiellia bacterium]HSA17801.1 hypothetical protein [Kiritimatiellia bacterium]
MTQGRRLLISLAASLAFWTLFSWPLPRHLFEAIPASSQNVEQDHAREMIPGDHLQLLYHFELLHGMLAGRTPWFHNVYEFNLGRDEDRFLPIAYYAPFSLLYAAFAGLAGQAFAWNLAGFVSLWLTYWLTWTLARRFVRSEVTAALAAPIGILLPYRWVCLLGGSPTGFAMLWVPAVWLGLDLAARDGRIAGGALAGAALLMLCWTDIQSLFFCGMATPLWLLLAALPAGPAAWREPAWRRRILRALAPIALFVALIVLYRWMRQHHLSAADLAAPRTMAEVSNFSPSPAGLVRWASSGLDSHIYVGLLLPLLLLAGLAGLLRRSAWKTPGERRAAVAFLLLGAATVFAVLLSLGVQGPLGGRLLVIIRLLVPPYSLLRQTAKVYCLMPVLLAVAAGLAAEIAGRKLRPKSFAAAFGLLVAGLVFEWRAQVRPTLCVLAGEQKAYAAVAEDARAADELPRALALPLWPGQDAFSSVYEYFAEKHGIRMVNGYSPVPRRAYVRDAYGALRSLNQGWAPDAALDDLLRRGVRYLLLHENLFPEQVSPFPVTTTLNRLRRHPRLDFLAHERTVWAFRIRPAPREAAAGEPGLPDGPAVFPARRWELERCSNTLCRAVEDLAASRGGGLALAQAGARVETPSTMASPIPGLRWMIRARGPGLLGATTLVNGQPAGRHDIPVAADAWTWHEAPISLADFSSLALRLDRAEGTVDADLALLAAGDWRDLAPGESRTIAAPCFFHGGYTEPAGNGVVALRKSSDPYAAILYGPKLPLAPGRYAAELTFASPAPAGAELGRLYVEGRDDATSTPVVAGRASARMEWDQLDNLPVNLVFVYFRNADMRIESIAIRRPGP